MEVRGLLFSASSGDKPKRQMGFPTKEVGRGEMRVPNTWGRDRKGSGEDGEDRILLSWRPAKLQTAMAAMAKYVGHPC